MIYFRKIIVAAAFVLAAATSTSAAIVDFEDVTADGSATANPFDSGGLTFSLGFLWDHNSPNSNGSTNLIKYT